MQDDGATMLLKNPLFFLSDPSLTTGVIQHIIAEFAKLNNILQQLFIVFTSGTSSVV